MNIQSVIKESQNYVPQNQDEIACQKEMLSFLHAFKSQAFSRENEEGHFSASCIVVNEEKTKVLFVYHLIYQSWSFVGGHADGNMDLFRIAKKELKEETGVTPLKEYPHFVAIQKLFVPEHIKHEKTIKAHYHYDVCYLFMAKESAPLKIKEDENKAVSWLPISNLSSYVSEAHMLPIYSKILRRMNLL